MANSDKNIVITPNIGSSSDDPKVVFTGANTAGLYPITLRAYPTSGGTLSFEGSAGQLFSITNSLSGTLFSVNDVSGIPSIEVLDTGLIKLAQYSGNIAIGAATTVANERLYVNGKIRNGSVWINNGDDNNGYNENIRLFNAPNGVSVIAFGASGVSGTPTTSILGYSDRFETRFNDGWQQRIYNGYAEASGSYRAPIFYDSNNTGYYFDGASTSKWNESNQDGWHTFNNYGLGITGTYDSYRLQTVFAMGSAYRMSAAGDSAANMYGIAWSHPNAGSLGGANNLNDHGILIINNGSFRAALSSRAVFSADVRGTLFYDYNDTGYYVDPASTSNLNVVAVQRAYAGYDAGVTGSFSCSNWFRSNGATGWYNASYEGGIYMEDSTWVRVYNSKAFYVANQIAATGNITAYYSDERLKTKVGKIENALQKVNQLEGFLYVNNEVAKANGYTSDRVQVALSAQQVQKVQPEVVSLAPFDMHTDEFSGKITSKSGENYLTIDYARLVPLLVEAIKEQQKQIEELRQIIATK